jgi:Lamin Tail Domain
MRKVLVGIGLAAALATMSMLSGASASAGPAGDGPGIQAAGQPVINEVATRGPSGTQDEFIEIMNPNQGQAFDLSGWQIRIYGANNNLLQVVQIPMGKVLQAFGSGGLQESFWVVGGTTFTGGFSDQPNAINVDIPDNGGVALFNPGGSKVDGFALSPAVFSAVEGQSQVPQSPLLDQFGPSYARNLLGNDLNNNRVDFQLHIRTPDQPN